MEIKIERAKTLKEKPNQDNLGLEIILLIICL